MPRLFITRRLRFTIARPMSLMDLRHPYTGVTTTACATIIVTVAVAIEAPTSAERDSSPSASRSVGLPEQSNRGTWIETDLLGAREGPRVRIPVPPAESQLRTRSRFKRPPARNLAPRCARGSSWPLTGRRSESANNAGTTGAAGWITVLRWVSSNSRTLALTALRNAAESASGRSLRPITVACGGPKKGPSARTASPSPRPGTPRVQCRRNSRSSAWPRAVLRLECPAIASRQGIPPGVA
jgi:hypothetical protein